MDDVFVFKSVDTKSTTKGFQIETCGTDYECPRNQITHILVHNNMIFFGDDQDHTLLNPNQILNYGITICNKHFDMDRGLLIKTNDKLDITLIMKGKDIGFMS